MDKTDVDDIKGRPSVTGRAPPTEVKPKAASKDALSYLNELRMTLLPLCDDLTVVIAKIPRVAEFPSVPLLYGQRTYESVIAFFLLLTSKPLTFFFTIQF